jgi:hypothetical protein
VFCIESLKNYFVTMSESRQVRLFATLFETQYSLNQIIKKKLRQEWQERKVWLQIHTFHSKL